jgi:hypothetical protein
MADDLFQDLYKLHRYATSLQGVVDDLASRLPQRVEGQDQTGAVRAFLDADGLPTSFQVDYDWKRNLRAAAFGDAVRQAVQDALNRRLSAWTRAFNDADLPEQAERIRQRVDDEPASQQIQPPTQPAPSASPDGKRPRDPGELIRDFLEVTSDLDAYANAATAQGSSAVAYGKLAVTLTAGGAVTCTADPSWVSDKTGEELTEALQQVFAAAREDLRRVAEASSPAARMNKLFDESLALLRDTGRAAGS